MLLKIGPETAHQALAIEAGLVLAVEIAGKFAPFRDDPAIALKQRQFFADAETADAGQRDQKAPVLGLGKRGDAAGAAGRIDRRIVCRQRRGSLGWTMPISRSPASASRVIAR